MGYWFCYQNTSSTTGERVNISTVLLLEDMGTDYTIVRRFNVEAVPGRDCLSGGQCCVSRNLSAVNQFGVNSSYHYGVVDLPDGPNMRQTDVSVGRSGYLFDRLVESTQSGDTLSKSGNPTVQPLKIFQFIIGELRIVVADESDYVCSFVFQTIELLMQLLPQHPLVPRLLLTLLPLVTSHLSLLPQIFLHHPQ